MTTIEGFQQPLIILGFHHSGTRLLAELLGQCGLFQVGQGKTYEWKYFQDLNDRIWESWWDLQNISIEELEGRKDRIDTAEILKGIQEHGYNGGAWGFKDPRTCTTLATWLKAFPLARTVHIVRDPRDVLGTLPPAYAKFTPGNSIPQDDLTFWSELWNKNMSMVREMMPLSAGSAELRYEDLCKDPTGQLDRIVSELGMAEDLNTSKANTSAVSSKEKKYLTWSNEGKLTLDQLNTITANTAPEMQRYGYS